MNENMGSDDSRGEISYVALGSNLGDRLTFLRTAIEMLHALPGNQVIGCSTIYQTKPIGVLEQPLFLNMVIAIATTRTAEQLFIAMVDIEERLGRTREVHWGPRTIDLDLLWFGDQTIASPHLTIPHPHMFERSFVLIPLSELVPRFSPQHESLIDHHLERLTDKEDLEQWTYIDWQIAFGHFGN